MTIVVWYLWLQCLGALGLALVWRASSALPDRGYCAAKTLSALLVGLVSWWGFALGLLRNGAGGTALAVLVLAAMAALSLGPARGAAVADIVRWVKRRWRLVVTIELLFAVAFFGWCLVRANDPAADHTEEPMDLMLLVAVSSSESFPPADPWLSGYPISYYYLGYWLLGALGHLVGTPPEITYNLGQATWYGLLLVGCFGLAFNLVAFSMRSDPAVGSGPGAGSAAAAGGVIAAVLVGASANLALPLDWGRRVLDGAGSLWSETLGSLKALFLGDGTIPGAAATLWSENWWWWRSSRVVHDVGLDGKQIEVITEFPFFSYLLGDNHPHVLAMPIVVATLTLAFAVFASARTAAPSAAAPPSPARGATLGRGVQRIGIVAVAGSIVAINTWDVPAVWSILVLAVAGAAATASDSRAWRRAAFAAISFSAVLALGAAILYLPYHLTASSQVKGILPNLFHPTSIRQVAVMFATLAPGVVLLLLSGWRRGQASLRFALAWWIALLGAALLWLTLCLALARFGWWSAWLESMVPSGSPDRLLGIVLERWSTGWVTLALCAGALALLLEALRARWVTPEVRHEAGLDFALLLAAAGLALIIAPELAYLHDSFATRMNTVFKFWYQAWLLLACAAAVGIANALRRGRGPRRAALLGLLAIVPGLFYPVTALWSRTGGFGAKQPTLDSLAWLERMRPDELQAIRWLRDSTAGESVVAQRSGASYRAEQNLPSIVSGRPTLLGWGGHEYQWRGSSFQSFAAGREEALERLYRPPSIKDLDQTLRAWRVDYVYVGPEERARYGVTAADENVLASAMDLVFENAQVRIYQRRG